MLKLAVLIRQSTLRAINEHSTAQMISGVQILSESEVLVLLDREVVETLLRHAQPQDRRIDDVLMRLAL